MFDKNFPMDGSVASRRVGPPRPGIAERIWEAARIEFSRRGYHGARVQGIARGASCNVALIYRHWASKRALYADILRSVWLAAANEISRLVESGGNGAESVIGAYLDAMMMDPRGAQILVREYLDGAPFLSQLTAAEPALLEPVRRAAAVIAASGADGARIDQVLAVVTVGGLSALVASAQEAVRPFLSEPLPPEAWRRHILELLSHGLVSGRAVPSRPSTVDGAAPAPP
jgi:TetR/AcrR family transcriptional regulator